MKTRGDEIEEGDEIEGLDGILPSPPPSIPPVGDSENLFRYSTEQEQDARMDVGPLIRLLPLQSPQRRFEILQQWEGVVTGIEGDKLWAELLDLTNPSNPTEIAEFPLIEIPRSDQPLLKPGSVFYWTMGYETSPGGQIRRVSEIRLRRTPEWSQSAVDAMKAKACSLLRQYSGNDEDDPTATH